MITKKERLNNTIEAVKKALEKNEHNPAALKPLNDVNKLLKKRNSEDNLQEEQTNIKTNSTDIYPS